jgi:hypothetical protein
MEQKKYQRKNQKAENHNNNRNLLVEPPANNMTFRISTQHRPMGQIAAEKQALNFPNA